MFLLKSYGIKNGIIEAKYGNISITKERDIPQISPPLDWQGAPKGTKTYAITLLDYDNVEDEGVIWIHWLVADIPKEIHFLEEDAGRKNKTLIQGQNSWALPYGPYEGTEKHLQWRYGGPSPERKHVYEFTIYALRNRIGLETGFTYNTFRDGIEGNILAEYTLKACYGK